eukprot:237698-Amphidinium_carterae.1
MESSDGLLPPGANLDLPTTDRHAREDREKKQGNTRGEDVFQRQGKSDLRRAGSLLQVASTRVFRSEGSGRLMSTQRSHRQDDWARPSSSK